MKLRGNAGLILFGVLCGGMIDEGSGTWIAAAWVLLLLLVMLLVSLEEKPSPPVGLGKKD